MILFDHSVWTLEVNTQSLITKISALNDAAQKGEVNLVLEENRPGNIKESFACLYTAWAKFQQDFLASSLLSTELWYAFNGYGSLVGREAQLKAV